MERMTEEELEKLKDFKVYVFEGDVYVKAEDYKEIAIENKKLRDYVDNLDSENDNQAIEIEELKKENKTLNIKVASLEGEIKGLNSVIEKIKEENQTLELWLDRKEKLNKGYREDVDYWHHRCMVAERGGEDEE